MQVVDVIMHQLLEQAGPLTVLILSLLLLGYYVGNMTRTIKCQIEQMANKHDLTLLEARMMTKFAEVEKHLLDYATDRFLPRDEFESRHKEIMDIARGKR